MNFYVPLKNETIERPIASHITKMPHILGRRFALTTTNFKYLDIGISVGSISHVEILIGDNRGNYIILPYGMWRMFIERRMNIEQLLQSSVPSSLRIQDLVLDIVKIRNDNIVKLTLNDTCMFMKPSTMLFIFELEHCVEHVLVQILAASSQTPRGVGSCGVFADPSEGEDASAGAGEPAGACEKPTGGGSARGGAPEPAGATTDYFGCGHRQKAGCLLQLIWQRTGG
ncbi:PREDICTED: uncharacterized protein LOC105449122 [Wasmannia auropunctata]|uniref:uncharacterized protein LOC105449122 n=1 Tax=Wasmannia auropunctata TaxID=64793 RepID=UPI0005EFC3E5|nr:PREDICTED: uncharacterized protein LOC105449122 [Wasmannia auropunctata]